MGRPSLANTKDTKAELAKVAMEMIQTRGYHAFSYQDLAERLNIRKASIHYHFPTKEDLAVELLGRSKVRFADWRARLATRGELSAETKLEAYVDYFADVSANCTRVCPCGTLASEWTALPEKLQKAVSSLIEVHRMWLKETLEQGRKEGTIAMETTAEEQAQFVYAGVQGGMQFARAQNNPGFFRAVTRQVLNALKR